MLYPPSALDASQVLQHAFDDTTQTLRTTAVATVITPPQLQVIITHTEDSIKIGNGTNLADITSSNALKVDGSAVTQPISASSLPLPTGAATAALQTSGNTTLSSIDGKLNSLGQKTMTGSVPVTIASDQTTVNISNVRIGATSASTSSVTLQSNAAQTLLSSNSNRKWVYIVNNSGAVVYLGLGATAVTNSGISIANNSTFIFDYNNLWLGSISAIVTSNNRTVQIIEGS